MSPEHAVSIGHTRSARGRGDSYDNLEPLLRELADLTAGSPEHAALRQSVIEKALPLGEHIAQRYSGRGVEYEDLAQIAACGVILAVDRFDPTVGASFLGFAIPTVMGEVKRYFRDSTWAVRVPRRIKELRQQLSVAIPELAQRLDRDPTARELAEHLDTDLTEVTQALIANNAYTTQSLDARSQSDDGDATPMIAPARLSVVEEGYALMEDSITIGPLLGTLSEREQRILRMRFGQEMSQAEIAKVLGVSQMQVSRLLAQTLKKLRDQAVDSELAQQIA
ncbi:SigB/SigF/SigG family RNA polymerase sigma factor [Nocardia sp. NPDC057668]|uniref:SigB/SigF/SigG family RNA polymerase sigma factor n=1 Tax=Nocardia sp. NPDC057668 TaxID=3346202 RepID=UPI003672FB7D